MGRLSILTIVSVDRSNHPNFKGQNCILHHSIQISQNGQLTFTLGYLHHYEEFKKYLIIGN